MPPVPPRAQAQGGEGAQDAEGLPGVANGTRRRCRLKRTARSRRVQGQREDVPGILPRPRHPGKAGVHRAHGQRQIRGPGQEARARRLRPHAPTRHGVPITSLTSQRFARSEQARVQDVQRHRRRRAVSVRHRVAQRGARGAAEDRADRPGLLPGEPGSHLGGGRALEFHHGLERGESVPGY